MSGSEPGPILVSPLFANADGLGKSSRRGRHRDVCGLGA